MGRSRAFSGSQRAHAVRFEKTAQSEGCDGTHGGAVSVERPKPQRRVIRKGMLAGTTNITDWGRNLPMVSRSSFMNNAGFLALRTI